MSATARVAAPGRAIVGVCLLIMGAGCGPGAEPEPYDSERAWSWVERLAADGMQGRRTGTPEGAQAADLIAGAFRAAGLDTAGDDGSYLHRFTFPFYRFVQPVSLALEVGDERLDLTWGDDFYYLNGSSPGAGRAKVLYVGYGVVADEYDDFAGVDVRGKVVLAMEGLPDGHRLDRGLAFYISKAAAARERGAVGLMLFGDPEQGSTFPETRIWVYRPSRHVAGFFIAKVDIPVAERILDGEAKALKAAVDAGGVSSAHDTGVRVHWAASVEHRPEAEGANVLGLLPGSDPLLADELVLVGAHYDGGGPDPDGTIYNGAEDNASGTGALLELVRVMAAGPDPVRRSVMFAAWGAEEQGAWGSARFLEEEIWPPDKIVVTFTMDNVGMGDGAFLLFGAHNFPEEFALISRGIDDDLLQRFTARGAGGSDGWSFQRRGIPALFAHADAPQPFVHTPEDDAATISPAMLDIVGRFTRQGILAAANAPADAFDRQGRLARYLARYAFVAGWLAPGAGEAVDWNALRRSNLDLLVIEAASVSEVARLAAMLPEGIQLIDGAADLASAEAGLPLRVLLAVAANSAPESDRDELLASSARAIAVRRDDAEPGAVTLMPLSPAAPSAGIGIRLVSSTRDLPGDPAGDSGPELVIDVAAGVSVLALIEALLERQVDAEVIQEILGNRLRRQVQKALVTP